MNRSMGGLTGGGLCVPRASGDEPEEAEKLAAQAECSPRQRG